MCYITYSVVTTIHSLYSVYIVFERFNFNDNIKSEIAKCSKFLQIVFVYIYNITIRALTKIITYIIQVYYIIFYR